MRRFSNGWTSIARRSMAEPRYLLDTNIVLDVLLNRPSLPRYWF
jgi:hypothetical protein